MVTAGEGTSYEHGGGGKFRKKPLRRGHTTPYDRPALVNPRNGWLSKLVVDPASKLISASAHLFFSSVFPKLLPPPPPPPGANHEPRDTLQVAEVEVPNILTGKIELATNDGGDPVNSTEGSGISELEQMLKQKTFTRYEIDRLTELLQSRTTDLPVEGEDKSVEPNLPKPVSGFERLELFTSSIPKENGIQSHILHEAGSTPVASARFLEEDVASPAELAKAYMGSRPSKVSPSLLGLRSQALKEDVTLLDNVPFPSKSPVMSLEPKSGVRGGFPDNGFLTPRARGRSAIYSMARTPYSRVYLAANQKGAGPSSSSSSSRFALQHDGSDGRFGSKQVVLKRRSSVFDDDDIGSVGPIRRIRQKTNLLSPKSSNLPVTENPLSSHRMEIGSNSTREKLPLFDKPKHKVSKMLGEPGEGDNIIRGTSYAFVPSKSTETATKILQHLEKLTPKKKSPESKFTKLTPGMLSEKALITLEDGDSSKFLQNVQDSRKLEFSRSINSGDAGESASQKQDKIEENGTKTLVNPSDTLAPAVDTAIPAKNPVPTFKNAGSVSANFVSQPPQKRSAFQMSAHEDYLELDHDVHSNGDASKLPAEEREKLEMPLMESSATVIEAVMVDKSRDFPKVKSPAVSQLNKRTDLEIKYGFMASENKSTSTFDKISPPKEPNVSPPLFSFGPKHVDKTPTFKFPASPSLHESPLKSSASSDPKPESSNSFPTVVFGASDAVTKIPESDNGDNRNTQKEREIPKKPVTVVSPAVSTSTSQTSGIFSFGAPAVNSNSNNGSLASSSYLFSSSALVPLSNGLATTTAASITALSGICTSSATTPAFSAAPMFGFGSSVASSSVSTASTAPDVQNTNAKVNTVKETNFGSPFGGPSSATASTGNGIFGFGASATSSTDNNQPPSSLFGTGCGSITQTMPVQIGSSNSAPGFGSVGASLTSSNSLFGSSTPAANMFSSVTSFGMSSSAASSETNSVGSSSDVSSSLFGSSWQSNKSPVFGASSGGSLFNSTSPSTGFAFGASSASSIFSFTSAAANTSSLTPFSQTQPIFGNSTPVFTASPSNNDQMSMEDSMAEDPVMTSTQSVPQVFSQPSIITPSAGFVSSAQSAGIPFQFSSQQSQAAPQNPSPFASGSLDFSAGGSFSLGSGGGDKANRKIIRVKKTRKK